MKELSNILLIIVTVYLSFAWFVFEWRNPLCNEVAFIKHFPSVVTFKELPQYQMPTIPYLPDNGTGWVTIPGGD